MSLTNPYAAPAKITVEKESIPEIVIEVPSNIVPTGTVPEVLAWVGADLVRAQLALDAELDGNKRKSLIATLQNIIG